MLISMLVLRSLRSQRTSIVRWLPETCSGRAVGVEPAADAAEMEIRQRRPQRQKQLCVGIAFEQRPVV